MCLRRLCKRCLRTRRSADQFKEITKNVNTIRFYPPILTDCMYPLDARDPANSTTLPQHHHKQRSSDKKSRHERGFSLVELAVVLVVVGLLLGLILKPLGAGYEQTKRHQAMLQLDEIRDSLIGFAAANGRLPCPASLLSAGQEASPCTQAHGFVPSVALGVNGNFNSSGQLLDPWGHPVRYSVSLADTSLAGTPGKPDFVSENEMHEVGMPSLKADLVICASAAVSVCSGKDIRANQVPAVVYSLGKDISETGHQAENLDNDGVFVVRGYSQIEGDGFDDLVVWLSDSLLFTRLIQAGTLP